MRCSEDRPTVHFSKRLVNGHHRTGDIHSPVDRLELLRRQAQGVAHCRTVTSEQLFGCLGGAPLPLPLPLPRRTGRWWSAFNLPTFDSKAPRMVCRSTPQVLARSPLPREGRRVRSAVTSWSQPRRRSRGAMCRLRARPGRSLLPGDSHRQGVDGVLPPPLRS